MENKAPEKKTRKKNLPEEKEQEKKKTEKNIPPELNEDSLENVSGGLLTRIIIREEMSL